MHFLKVALVGYVNGAVLIAKKLKLPLKLQWAPHCVFQGFFKPQYLLFAPWTVFPSLNTSQQMERQPLSPGNTGTKEQC